MSLVSPPDKDKSFDIPVPITSASSKKSVMKNLYEKFFSGLSPFRSSGKGILSIEKRVESFLTKINPRSTEELLYQGELNEFWRSSLKKFIENEFSYYPREANCNKNKEALLKKLEHILSTAINIRGEPFAKTEKELIIVMSNSINDFKSYSKEIVSHFKSDQEEISQLFFDGKGPVVLEEIIFGGSETHYQGRQTAFLILNVAGERKKLVYKPRDIRLDQALASNEPNSVFERMNRYVQEKSPQSPKLETSVFGTYRFLPKTEGNKHYGYVELIEDVADKRLHLTENEAIVLAWKIGFIKRVTDLLTLTDLHFDNYIAIGDQIFLIDLEAGLSHNFYKSSETYSGFISAISEPSFGKHAFRMDSPIEDEDQFLQRWEEAFVQGMAEGEKAFFSENLQDFIPTIGEDIAFREVPIATNELIHAITIPKRQIFVEDTTNLIFEKYNLKLSGLKESDEIIKALSILEEQLITSSEHNDVPVFKFVKNKTGGELFCNEKKFFHFSDDFNSLYLKWLEKAKNQTIEQKQLNNTAKSFMYALQS